MAKRLYSLFEKVNGKWVRKSELAFTKDKAVRIFQNALLAGMGELRPISNKDSLVHHMLQDGKPLDPDKRLDGHRRMP